MPQQGRRACRHTSAAGIDVPVMGHFSCTHGPELPENCELAFEALGLERGWEKLEKRVVCLSIQEFLSRLSENGMHCLTSVSLSLDRSRQSPGWSCKGECYSP